MMAELIVAVVAGTILIGVATAWTALRDRPDESPSAEELGGSRADSGSRTNRYSPSDGGTASEARLSSRAKRHGDHSRLRSDDDRTVCRYCGEVNHAEFRYCRRCVSRGFAVDDTVVSGVDESSTARRPP